MRKTSKRNYDAEMEKRFVCQEKPCHRSRAFSPLREEAANASSKKVRTLGKRKSPSIFFELLSLLICRHFMGNVDNLRFVVRRIGQAN